MQFGTNNNDYFSVMAVDSSDNVYIGVDRGALWRQLGGLDYWLAKYDPSGTQLWIVQFGSNNNDYVSVMAVDSSDNVFIGETYDTLTGASWGLDYWLAKYDPSGTQQWIVQFGSSSSGAADYYDNLHAMAMDSSDNVYIGVDHRRPH